MKIAFVEIQNVRKLKAVRVEFGPEKTVFVGANNSGKTSAMDALILFLQQNKRKDFATTDITLSNWLQLNRLGEKWASENNNDSDALELSIDDWMPHLPALDLWLQVDQEDIHRVVHLLPTLDWSPSELLGLRLVLAPRDLQELYRAFCDAFLAARKTEESKSKSNDTDSSFALWPRSMREFLDKHFHNHFGVQSYILDPSQCTPPIDGIANPQELPPDSDPLDNDPITGLFKIHIITAQRGFADPKSEDEAPSGFASLSTQLRRYFVKHLDPTTTPGPADIDALEAIEAAKAVFDTNLKTSFAPAIEELEGLNYPGFSDPRICLTSRINAVDSLNHKTAVQFTLPGSGTMALPETYNGLGYQNLISMVFSLIRYRDEWMRVGKVTADQDHGAIEPVHLVLIEEPEAHLHAQVQQVFIKKAYNVLRNHELLANESLTTQMVVSTHSSHVAHELDFSCLRYFRREPGAKAEEVPFATVVNLSKAFGSQTDTSKFVTRYIRTTHCDLFFADAVILIEGAAERILLPHFIRMKFPKLDHSYISLLEVGGAHAHRLKPLLETLGILTLVVTDIDSIPASSDGKKLPKRKKGYRTGNTTLKDWLPQKSDLDELLDLEEELKVVERIRVAYQCPIMVNYVEKEDASEAIPYTFEDSLALTNLSLFRNLDKPIGLLGQLKKSLEKDGLEAAQDAMFKALGNGKKAELALELLLLAEPDALLAPSYINDGLAWLETTLGSMKLDIVFTTLDEVEDA